MKLPKVSPEQIKEWQKVVNADMIGGRKFVLALIALLFMVGIFVVMIVKGWLNAEYCMRFLGMLPIIVGLFVGGNVVDKYMMGRNGNVKRERSSEAGN